MTTGLIIALGVVGLFIILRLSHQRRRTHIIETEIEAENSDPHNIDILDEEHAIEWRHKYLMARIKYLENKIDKKTRGQDRGFPVLESLPDADLETQIPILETNVERLETFLQRLK